MQLAQPGEPLELADGTKIDPATGRVIKPVTEYVEVPTDRDAVALVTRVRSKTITDLPAPPKQMNAISLIVLYTLYGLDDTQIAVVAGITKDQVTQIKMLDAFDKMLGEVTNNIMDAETSDVGALFKQNARAAAIRVATLVDSEDDDISLRASKDVLDRAGHRPADVVEHRLKLEADDLRIVVIKKDETQVMPAVDVDFTVNGDK